MHDDGLCVRKKPLNVNMEWFTVATLTNETLFSLDLQPTEPSQISGVALYLEQP